MALFDMVIAVYKEFQNLQLTIYELLHKVEVKMRPQFGTFKQTQRVQ
jgi:hypothetical protein